MLKDMTNVNYKVLIAYSGQVTKNKHFRYSFILSELKSNSSQEDIGTERQEKLTTTKTPAAIWDWISKPNLHYSLALYSP